MLECIILGDSIAVGTHLQRLECVSYSKVGINSEKWNKQFLSNNLSAKTVIISLGSNDHKGVRTKAEFQRIREKVGTQAKVFWILPAIKPEVQEIVKQMATEYGDSVLPITQVSRDNIHPTSSGYRDIADRTR